MKLVKSQFDLVDLVARITGRCFDEKEAGSIDLDLPESADAFADERSIEQVLINYVNNAREHLKEGGRIRISIGESEDMTSWVLRVINDGEPVPESCLPFIWDSFYRADKARSRENGRYGLGLSIVRAIQAMHGRRYGALNMDGKVEFWAEVEKYEEEA